MSDPDRRLAGRAGRGDRKALAGLYERHGSRLYGYLVKLLGRPETAEDVFQETWIKVMQGIESYRPGGATFRGWLYRVASNAAVDRMRRDARRAGPELDAPNGEADERERVIDGIVSPEPDPERLGVATELHERLAVLLGELPDVQRAAVLLRHQQGLTYAELSRALAVPEGTAKTLVHRGVYELRRRLTEIDE